MGVNASRGPVFRNRKLDLIQCPRGPIKSPMTTEDGQHCLDPDPEEMRRLGYQAVDLVVEWMAKLPEAPVGRFPSSEILAPLVEEPMPRKGRPVEEGMQRFLHDYMPFATLVNHPRFFAYIPCPGSYIGALGSFLASATNLFTSTWIGGSVAAQLEEQLLSWIREAIHLPQEFRGVLTSGGSIANLSALAAARTRLPAEKQKLGIIYVSSEAHFSITKAAQLLDITPAQIRTLPVDSKQRLVPADVATAMAEDVAAGYHPLLLCASLGTTSTGAIDPLDELAEITQRYGAWFHVDGAYGAAVRLLPEYRDATAGLAKADSVTLDPHKWLYAPMESGCFLTRDMAALETAFTGDGEYMQDIPLDEINLFRRGPELTRGNRALKLWLLLRSVGLDKLTNAIRRDITLCHLACDLLSEDPDLEIVTPPQLSVFSFAAKKSEAITKKLMSDILEDGFLMLSSSQVDGRYVLRLCVLNHRTTEQDIRDSVERIRALLHEPS